MKNVAEWILGILVMALAVVAVWEYTIIRDLKQEVKSKQLMEDAQSVRMRDLQEQIVDKDNTIRMLTTPKQTMPDNTHALEKEVDQNIQSYRDGMNQRQ